MAKKQSIRKSAVVFLASAVSGAILTAGAPALAVRFRVLDIHGCSVEDDQNQWFSYYCQVPSGSEFDLESTTSLKVDAYTSVAGGCYAIACRQNWFNKNEYCGSPAWCNTTGNIELSPSLTYFAAGTIFDYRWVHTYGPWQYQPHGINIINNQQ